MPILETFVASRYTGAYNGVDVGICEEGYELSTTSSAEMVEKSDAYGDSVIDGVYRGGNYFLQFMTLAYTKGTNPFWPYSTMGQMGVIGRMLSDIATTMSLTAVLNVTPNTLTASKSILAENFDAKLLYTSRLRKVPIRLRLLPYLVSSSPVWYTMTG